jgi:periplasmic protein CpxP/Spy
MKSWIKRTLIATFGLVGATALVAGLSGCGHHHQRHAWHDLNGADAAKFKAKVVDKASSKLDLDSSQKAKLDVLVDKLREQSTALVPAGSNPRSDVQALIAGNTFDRNKASAWIDGKLSAVQNKSPEVVAAMADFFDNLKPEQQAKLRDMLNRRGRRG